MTHDGNCTSGIGALAPSAAHVGFHVTYTGILMRLELCTCRSADVDLTVIQYAHLHQHSPRHHTQNGQIRLDWQNEVLAARNQQHRCGELAQAVIYEVSIAAGV